MSWVQVETITGGQLVRCGLCGRRVCSETFWATDTNHAEAYRLAVAYAWHHEHSGAHIEALRAFNHGDLPPFTREERVLWEIFGEPLPDEKARRRQMAKRVAERVTREERKQRWRRTADG